MMMKSDDNFEWKVQTFIGEETISSTISELESDGWKVFYIDLSESKIIVRKPKAERLDG